MLGYIRASAGSQCARVSMYFLLDQYHVVKISSGLYAQFQFLHDAHDF